MAIVEEKDADDRQRAVDEVNSGMYAFALGPLREALHRITTDNAQGEEYLTDVVALMREASLPVARASSASAMAAIRPQLRRISVPRIARKRAR